MPAGLASLGLLPLVLAGLGSAPRSGARQEHADESLSDLRLAVEAALGDGLEADELRALAARWEILLARASSPGEVASLALVARTLCAAGAPRDVEPLRAQALRALVAAAPRSGRARRLLAGDFLPGLEHLQPAEQAPAVRRYDEELARLAGASEDPAVRAALAWAPLHLRLEVARTWDAPWLDGAERARTLAALDALAAQHGALEGPTGTTYAELVSRSRAELEGAAFGQRPAWLTGRDLAGEPLALDEARGAVVLVVFWSSWCLPCLEAVPEERELLVSLAGEPFRLLGVCADAEAAEGRATAERTGMTWPSLHDGPAGGEGTGSIARALGVRAWPSAVLLDRAGRLRAKFLSTSFRPHWTLADVRAAIHALLRESER